MQIRQLSRVDFSLERSLISIEFLLNPLSLRSRLRKTVCSLNLYKFSILCAFYAFWLFTAVVSLPYSSEKSKQRQRNNPEIVPFVDFEFVFRISTIDLCRFTINPFYVLSKNIRTKTPDFCPTRRLHEEK